MIVAVFVVWKIMLTFVPVAVIARELSNFILTHAPVQIGAFSYTFDAVLLLTEKRKTDNTLSISVLSASFMFNPKKRGMYNEMVTNG